MSKTDFAFWLGLYAGVVASATGLWTLFRELWLERARLVVTAEEAWLVPVKGQARPLVVKGEEMLKTMAIQDHQRTPILTVKILNRGRRDARIETISQFIEGGKSHAFGDLLPQLPFIVPAEQSAVVAIGKDGGYAHGDIALDRFYAVDGADRIHPLSERYRRRLRRLLRRSKPLTSGKARELEV